MYDMGRFVDDGTMTLRPWTITVADPKTATTSRFGRAFTHLGAEIKAARAVSIRDTSRFGRVVKVERTG